MTSTLDKAARMKFDDYNPDLVIDAVNALQPLGKQKAIDEITAYLSQAGETGSDAVGLFWVLRVLFDVPQGQAFPPVRLGQPDVAPPASPDALPRFPIVVARDVPLLVVRSYLLGGFPEPVIVHVTYFQVHGVLRTAPLVPSRSKSDVTAEFTRQWKAAYDGGSPPDVAALVDAQLARMR